MLFFTPANMPFCMRCCMPSTIQLHNWQGIIGKISHEIIISRALCPLGPDADLWRLALLV